MPKTVTAYIEDRAILAAGPKIKEMNIIDLAHPSGVIDPKRAFTVRYDIDNRWHVIQQEAADLPERVISLED